METKAKRSFNEDGSEIDIDEEITMDYPQRFNDRYPELAEKVNTL